MVGRCCLLIIVVLCVVQTYETCEQFLPLILFFNCMFLVHLTQVCEISANWIELVECKETQRKESVSVEEARQSSVKYLFSVDFSLPPALFFFILRIYVVVFQRYKKA